MRPKLTLMLVLTIITVMFMAFLVKENGTGKIAVDKKCTCCKKVTAPADSGGGDASNGTINHLIVSTLN